MSRFLNSIESSAWRDRIAKEEHSPRALLEDADAASTTASTRRSSRRSSAKPLTADNLRRNVETPPYPSNVAPPPPETSNKTYGYVKALPELHTKRPPSSGGLPAMPMSAPRSTTNSIAPSSQAPYATGSGRTPSRGLSRTASAAGTDDYSVVMERRLEMLEAKLADERRGRSEVQDQLAKLTEVLSQHVDRVVPKKPAARVAGSGAAALRRRPAANRGAAQRAPLPIGRSTLGFGQSSGKPPMPGRS
jgi:hypothetical protein